MLLLVDSTTERGLIRAPLQHLKAVAFAKLRLAKTLDHTASVRTRDPA
jgi:hypothetical protein